MTVSENNLRLAVRNVARHGDTDVLPFPLENHWLNDAEDTIAALLTRIDSAFDASLSSYPVAFERVLAAVGYHGFRSVTQIDAIWNCYLLALTLQLGADIEASRLEPARGIVFSYRFAPNAAESTLFDKSYGWLTFQKTALAHAAAHKFAIATDVADFYPRIYHHRLKNSLDRATSNKEAVRRIMCILSELSGGTSYGLPVGGNAARLLAEVVLDSCDRLLLSTNRVFCRFVDDYVLFADSREDAQRALVVISEMLNRNEGLTLSRAKTRIMSAAEFLRSSPVAEPDVAESEDELKAREFMRIRLAYDPYSDTAEEDYDELAKELALPSQFWTPNHYATA